jgi:hypothetical protein
MPPKAVVDARTLRALARARAQEEDQAQSGPSGPPQALPTRGRKRAAAEPAATPRAKKVRKGRNPEDDLEDLPEHDEPDEDNVVQPPFLQDPPSPAEPRPVTQGLGKFTWVNADGIPYVNFDDGISEDNKAKFLADASYQEINPETNKKVQSLWEGKKLLGIG